MSQKESIYPSIHPSEPEAEDAQLGTETMDGIDALRSQIRRNIDYERLATGGGYLVQKYAPEIYRLICDIVCIDQKSVRIGGKDYPYALVRERFLQLTGEDVEYVVESMSRVSSPIGNIRAYLLTALYNAPATREQYLRAKAAEKACRDGGAVTFREFLVDPKEDDW